MSKFTIIDIATSLFLFVLWLTITLTIMSILFNPLVIVDSVYNSDAPLWGKLCFGFFSIVIILPTTPYVKSYYATSWDVILFIFRCEPLILNLKNHSS